MSIPVIPINDVYGLNKAARRMAERREADAANAPMPLEPDFPYVAVGFPNEVFVADTSLKEN